MTTLRRFIAISLVLSMLLAGCTLGGGNEETVSAPVTVDGGGEVSVSGLSVSVAAGALSGDGNLEITTRQPPATRPGLEPIGQAIEVSLEGAELTGEATVSFPASKSDFPDGTVPVVIWEDSEGGWRWLPTQPVTDGQVIATTDHFSNGLLARLDPRQLASELAADIGDYVMGRSGVDQPSCGDEEDARAAVEVASDGGDAVKWCLGLENGTTVLKVANNRRTFAQVTFPASWQVQEGLKASISSDALVRALGTGAASLGLQDRTARVIDGGDTITLAIPDGGDGRVTVEASFASWALTGIKFGIDLWMSAAAAADGRLDEAADGAWERIAKAIDSGDNLDAYGEALAACGEGVPGNLTEDIGEAEAVGALLNFQIDCVPALMQADIEETGFTMWGLGFVVGLVNKIVSLAATAANLVVTGLREVWDNIASFGGQSDAIYDIDVTAIGMADPGSRGAASTQTPSSRETATSSGPEPILFVFDTSSSMSESGDDGVVRLEGAKAAAIESIYGLPTGTNAGVWAYPDDGDCSAGRNYLDVTELDISRLTAEIQNLQPDGNTPTAAALRAATDYLKEKGFDSGTIVLASDGEANCQDDPCEVAQQIVAEGFDLTVNPAGINISDAGFEQLQCIANATGGEYYDVTDAQELAESLRTTSQPSLRLEVDGHDGNARADSRATITATVANESPSIEAVDVALSLSFLGTNSGGLALPAIPPVYRLGNIPAGESVTRSWTVSTGEEGIAYPRLLAQPSNAPYVQVDGELTISARPATLDDAGSLLTDAERIVILGDSYSSGEGAGTGPDAGTYVSRGSAEGGCHRSLNTYGLSLYGIDNEDAIIACSGALTEHYLNGNADRDRKEQRHYLQALLRDEETRADAVLLTFGGNDIGFADVVATCAVPTDCTKKLVAVVDNPLSENDGIEGDLEIPLCTSERADVLGVCESWAERRLRQAAQVKTQLASTYAKIAQDIARETPSGTEPIPLIVLPYVQIITNTYGQGCSHLSDAERRFGVDLLRTLNLSIEQAVKETQEQGWVVYYARDVTQAVLPGHTACAPQFDDRHINAIDIAGTLNPDDPGALAPCLAVPATGVLPSPLAWSCLTAFASQVKADAQELMHPNTRGYQSITNALVEWSALPAVEQQWRSDQDAPPRADDRLLRVTEALSQPVTLFSGSPQVTLGLGAATNPQTVTAGVQITVTAEGFAPGVPVRVQLESSPVTLAAVNATDDGLLSVLVTVPAGSPAGEHHLTAEGTGVGGQTVLFRESITVAPATPLWILIVAAAALLAAGAAIVLHMNGRRTR